MSEGPGRTTNRPQEAAGRYLEQLLATVPYYRDKWEMKAARGSLRGVNRTAVARVLMEYVDFAGEARIDSERQLLDRVRRAFQGNPLEPRTVGWFVKAFDFEQEHEDTLRDLLYDADERVRRGDVIVGGSDLRATRPWRTLALHDMYVLGADGFPLWFEELQVVEALQDGLDTFQLVFDTAEADLEAIWGGTPEPLTHSEGNWYRSQIRFGTPARRGEAKSFRYKINFRYTTMPELCFRRGAPARTDTVELRVQFHGYYLPSEVWWCQWDNPEEPAVARRHCDLDEYNQVACIHRALQQTYVGFCWYW